MTDPNTARILSLLGENILGALLGQQPQSPEDGDWNAMMEGGCRDLFNYLRLSSVWNSDECERGRELGTSEKFGATIMERITVHTTDNLLTFDILRFSAQGRKYATLELSRTDAEYSFAVFQPQTEHEWHHVIATAATYAGDSMDALTNAYADQADADSMFTGLFTDDNQNSKKQCQRCGTVH